MTNTNSNNFVSTQPSSNDAESDALNDNDESLASNTMQTIKKLIGYEYYTTRAVFEHNGNEIVYVNDGFMSRVKLYINGIDEATSWAMTSDLAASVSCRYTDHSYEVKSRITNLITMAQKVTLVVDGVEQTSKVDPRLAALSPKQLAHFFGGMVGMGLVLGGILSLFI